MRRIFVMLLAVGVGVVLGRMFDDVGATAAAGGDQGGGAAVSGNGDVNGDGRINIADASYLLNWLFLGGPEPEPCEGGGGRPSGLPDTGQTACYDTDVSVIECTTKLCPGQDGFYATGCPSEGRFIDNEDGTVTDTCTGLMWQKDKAPGSYAWCDALVYCETLEFAGQADWRLPNMRELLSLVDYGRWNPATDPVFGRVTAPWYWSSSTDARYIDNAWIVSFYYGIDSLNHKGSLNRVRAVRSGP